jgi:hypothetical protein
VQDQDAIAHDTVRVFAWLTHRAVVNLHCRQRLAALEREVANNEVAFDRRGVGRLCRRKRGTREKKRKEKAFHPRNLT